jgi:ribonuclease HI
MKKVTVYTDGGASGNPGPGGYGVVLISGDHYKELSGAFRLTTNNRMELLAVILALEALNSSGTDVTIYSDSKYVVDAVKRFLKIYEQHKVKFVWVKGHAGNEFNEVADKLAVSAYADGILPLEVDEAYEASKKD